MELQKTYKELVESYFELTNYLTGENDPKLTKQLQKAGIEFTVEEVQAFQELLLAVFDNEKEVIFTFNFSNILPDYKVTRVQTFGFNQMEGLKYLVNISIKTQEGYKDKRIKMVTNSTYIDDYVWDENLKDEDNFSEWLKQSVGF